MTGTRTRTKIFKVRSRSSPIGELNNLFNVIQFTLFLIGENGVNIRRKRTNFKRKLNESFASGVTMNFFFY